MRIAGFIRLLPIHRGVGGMQGHAQTLYRGLAKVGHDVHVFTTSHPSRSEDEVEENVHIHYLKGTAPSVYSTEYFENSKAKFLELHNRKPFDIIHTESTAARRLTKGPVPVCATWHGTSYCGFRSKMNEVMARGTICSSKMMSNGFVGIMKEIKEFEKYDHHIAISHQVYSDLQTIYGLSKERVSLVFNGFDGNQFKPDPTAGQTLRKQIGIPAKAYVFGAGGRLTVDKGHRLLIRVIPEIIKKFGEAYLLIVGEGSIENEYKRLRLPRLKILGPKSYAQMPAVYNAMNIFINPTLRYLGLDLTMQEAMLCGLPVIATDTGSIKESLIPNEAYGLTHEVGNCHQLLAAIIKARKLQFDRDKICNFIRGFSTIENMIQGMEGAFKAAIAHRSK